MHAVVSTQAELKLGRERAEDFLYAESRLADEHRFDEWMALWDDGPVLYWIPSNSDELDPGKRISIAYDDRVKLEDRIFRLQSRAVHAQRPRSRMRRLVSNVTVESDNGSIACVEANFMLMELRTGRQDVFGGRIIYRLRYDADTVRMIEKKVLLLNNDAFIDNLTFLL